MTNSRRKGKRGELEAAEYIREHGGFMARRSQQYCGKGGDADVIAEALHDYHIEVKRRQQLSLQAALNQARKDAPDKIPLIMHRKDFEEWKITMSAADCLRLLGRAHGQ